LGGELVTEFTQRLNLVLMLVALCEKLPAARLHFLHARERSAVLFSFV
jgi:hypothetical protein